MIAVALLLAAVTLFVGLGAAFLLRLLPTVRLQLAGLALLAVVVPLAAVLTSGWVMFHMHDDAKILAVSSAAALSARANEQGPEEVAELGLSFNKMAESIERLFDARRQLVAWASHDLRTPLSSVQAMLEAIEDDLAEPAEYVPEIRNQVRILSGLVDDLFELTRIDAGVLTLELQETTLEDIVESCVRGLEADARAKGIRLEASWESELPAVHCAPDKVERILHNLAAEGPMDEARLYGPVGLGNRLHARSARPRTNAFIHLPPPLQREKPMAIPDIANPARITLWRVPPYGYGPASARIQLTINGTMSSSPI